MADEKVDNGESTSGFVDFEDLSSLEGMEEYESMLSSDATETSSDNIDTTDAPPDLFADDDEDKEEFLLDDDKSPEMKNLEEVLPEISPEDMAKELMAEEDVDPVKASDANDAVIYTSEKKEIEEKEVQITPEIDMDDVDEEGDSKNIDDVLDMSAISDVDGMPETSDESDMEALPDISEIPDIPDIPDAKEASEIPEIQDDISLDEGSSEQSGEDMMNISDIDELPDISDIPDVNDLPDANAPDGELDDMLDGLLNDLEDIHEDKSMNDVSDQETQENLNLSDLLEKDMLSEEEAEKERANPGGKKQPGKISGFFKRIFGNIVTDEIAEAERQAEEDEKAREAELAEENARKKEEQAKEKEEKKAESERIKEEKKAKKEEEKAKKAQEKADKKAAKEAAAAEEAAKFEAVGKLNKVGVSIIAVLSIIFLTAVIITTNVHGSYRTKKQAKNYFSMGKYTMAYTTALGTDLKKKDPETYDKIITVMKVQRSVNAYENYYDMNYYPEALNALLIGLKRYDTNIERARELDVVADIDSCKGRIVGILDEKYDLDEQEAKSLLTKEKGEYTKEVVRLAMEKK